MEVFTFNEDLLELRDFSDRLETFISVEHHFVQGSLVIALSSKFGSGKTTFLRMWKSKIENSDSENEKPLVISLNAWESDYFGDPLFAIVSGLVASLKDEENDKESLINAAKNVGGFAIEIGGQVVKKYTGVDLVAAKNQAEKRKIKRAKTAIESKDSFTIYRERKEAMEKLKLTIKNIVASSEPRVLFFVDELDRCRPDYAISYLETIKHIFDMQGAVFILAADRDQLENSARTAFGSKLDFEEYFRKFVQREISLPPISDSGYHRLASSYSNLFLERANLRNCFMKFDETATRQMVELIAALRLTPRQIQEAFRIMGHVFEISEKQKGNLKWCLGIGTICMSVFKVGNNMVFNLLGNQNFTPKNAFDFLIGLFGNQNVDDKYQNVDFWFMVFATGKGLKAGDGESVKDLFEKFCLEDGRQPTLNYENTDSWYSGWGHPRRTKPFVRIREMIEQILQWK